MKWFSVILGLVYATSSFASQNGRPDFVRAENNLFNSSDLSQLEKYLFSESGGIRTDALLIQKDGKVIYEGYARGYNSNVKHTSWSMAKSISGMLFGIAEQRGWIRRDETLSSFSSAFPNLPTIKSSLKIADFLHMSSGILYQESYDTSPTHSDTVAMLYRNGIADVARYTLALPQAYLPGQKFSYSSGDTNIVWAALKSRIPHETYNQFPSEALFKPLGIKDFSFEQDQSGVYIGSSYLYLTPRDFAKLGQLVLQKGEWNGQPVVPAEWLQYQAEPVTGMTYLNGQSGKASYGAEFWLNRPVQKNAARAFLNISDKAIIFFGYAGQYTIIIPEENMVIVRLGEDDTDSSNSGVQGPYMVDLVLKALGHDEINAQPATHWTSPFSPPLTATPSPVVIENGWDDGIKKPQSCFLDQLTIGSHYAAKEYCSCRWIVGQTHEFCEASVNKIRIIPNWIYFTAFDVDEKNHSVRTRVLGSTAGQAQFMSPELGCRLSPDP